MNEFNPPEPEFNPPEPIITIDDPIFDCLYRYQRAEVLALTDAATRHPCVIEGGDTGTGKTHVMAAVCKLAGAPVFVISPKPVVSTWFDVLGHFGCRVLGVSNFEAIKNGKYYTSAAAFFADRRIECPYVQVAGRNFEWNFPPNAYIIVDEAHKGKNNSTITAAMLLSLKPMITAGAEAAANTRRLFILSATIADKVECFRVPAFLLGVAQYGKHAYAIWLKQLARNCPGMLQTEAIHRIIYPEYGSRMRIADVRADLETAHLFQPNYVRAELIDVSPEVEDEIIRAYADIEEATQRLRNKQQGEIHPLTAILRARQRIEMLKVPPMAMTAQEKMGLGRAVVIFINFTETATNLFKLLDDFVQEEFRSFITFIHGGQSGEERAFQISKFQSGESICMIANIAAANLGVSLHHKFDSAKPRTSIISPPWSGIVLKQTLGRIDRAGNITEAEQLIIYCRGRVSPAGPLNPDDTTFNSTTGPDGMEIKVGVEEKIADAVNAKLKNIEWINNGHDDDLLLI